MRRQLKIEEMTDGFAIEINSWKYEYPYEMYSFDGDYEDYGQLMSGYYFAVTDETRKTVRNNVIGFFAIGPAAQKICDKSEDVFKDESFTDIAFGLRPDLTGKGIGRELVEVCISEAKSFFPEDGIRICVMKNNDRALRLYSNMGFEDVFENDEYMIMTLKND